MLTISNTERKTKGLRTTTSKVQAVNIHKMGLISLNNWFRLKFHLSKWLQTNSATNISKKIPFSPLPIWRLYNKLRTICRSWTFSNKLSIITQCHISLMDLSHWKMRMLILLIWPIRFNNNNFKIPEIKIQEIQKDQLYFQNPSRTQPVFRKVSNNSKKDLQRPKLIRSEVLTPLKAILTNELLELIPNSYTPNSIKMVQTNFQVLKHLKAAKWKSIKTYNQPKLRNKTQKTSFFRNKLDLDPINSRIWLKCK